MTTIPSAYSIPKPLSGPELRAIEWYANAQVKAALAGGVISNDQVDAHWRQVAADLANDAELLKKMVQAHRRYEQGDRRASSSRTMLEHDMFTKDAAMPSVLQAWPQDLAPGGLKRSLAAAGTVALCVAGSAVNALNASSQTTGPGVGMSQPGDVRRESMPELPPEKKIEPVLDDSWVRRRRRSKEKEGQGEKQMGR